MQTMISHKMAERQDFSNVRDPIKELLDQICDYYLPRKRFNRDAQSASPTPSLHLLLHQHNQFFKFLCEFSQNLNFKLSLLQWNWTEYLTLMFEGIQNVTLDLEGEDKIMVTNANYLNSLLKLLSETPRKTLGKYRPLILLGNFRWRSSHQCHVHLYVDCKFKILINA